MKRNDVLMKYARNALFEVADCVVNDGRNRTIANALYDLVEFANDDGLGNWDAEYACSKLPALFSLVFDGFADEWRSVCDHRKPSEE